MFGIQRRNALRLLQHKRIIRFINSNSTKLTNKKTELKITEESDFAFRKTQISELNFIEQDKEFYPILEDCIKKLTDGIENYKQIRIPEFRDKYFGIINLDNLKDFDNDPKYLVNGKIKSIRKAGKGSFFIDLIQDFEKIQLIVHHKIMNIEKEEFNKIHLKFKPGDQVIGIGHVGITKVGELSIKLDKPLILTSPSLHPIPPKFNDIGKINSNRVIDYLVNQESKDIILLRCKIIQIIRKYFEDKGFLNVETPIICNGNSGANARPFETKSQFIEKNDNDKLNLRVAPELWLKRLIISGFDKIFEIGKSFRNEGIDSTHNPEFTTCEFYQTFIGLNELMRISEELIIIIIKEILNDKKFQRFHLNLQEIFNKIEENKFKFIKIEFLNELKNQTGIELKIQDFTINGLIEYYKKIGKFSKDIENKSEIELINKLIEDYLEPISLKNGNLPVFIYNIPEIISPLSKSNLNGISKRFEMFINGKEFINAYEEENNPFKQKFKFIKQQINKDKFNDFESLIPDYKFVEFMEWGMPPTGGWGMGIDRLVMKLSGVERIEKVLPFGKLNDVIKQ